MYSNISHFSAIQNVGVLQQIWLYEIFGVCYWCVKITQYGYMGHGLKLITFYVQKHIAFLAMCHKPPLVRDKPLDAPASVKLVYSILCSQNKLWVHKKCSSVTGRWASNPDYACLTCHGKARPTNDRLVTQVDIDGTMLDVDATFGYMGYIRCANGAVTVPLLPGVAW